MSDQYIGFHNKHIGPIFLGEKYRTARYGFTRDLTVGETIDLKGKGGLCFAQATLVSVQEMTVKQFYEADLNGHRSYDNLEHFLDVMHSYYPDKDINENSILTVCGWDDVEPETPMEWHRDGDIEHVLDSLEQQLLEEDMHGASRDMIVEGTFQRIRDELDEISGVTSAELLRDPSKSSSD